MERRRKNARRLSYGPDENPGHVFAEVNPAAQRGEQVDSNIVIRPVKPTADYSTSAVL